MINQLHTNLSLGTNINSKVRRKVKSERKDCMTTFIDFTKIFIHIWHAMHMTHVNEMFDQIGASTF